MRKEQSTINAMFGVLFDFMRSPFEYFFTFNFIPAANNPPFWVFTRNNRYILFDYIPPIKVTYITIYKTYISDASLQFHFPHHALRTVATNHIQAVRNHNIQLLLLLSCISCSYFMRQCNNKPHYAITMFNFLPFSFKIKSILLLP
jgi:hypothetical protein